MRYRLTLSAEADIARLYVDGVRHFGPAQAESYFAGLEAALEFLADYPRAARERREIDPPVRIHRCRSHMIVSLIDGPGPLILRVRHAREDWEASPT